MTTTTTKTIGLAVLLLWCCFWVGSSSANVVSLEEDASDQLLKSTAKPLQRDSHGQNKATMENPSRPTKKWMPQLAAKGLTYGKVLSESKRINANNKKFFPNEVLGYITPWNSDGYDVALRFQSKFTFLSPVWFQIKRQSPTDGHFRIEGKEGIDRGWIERMREATTKRAKILPRFLMEAWSRDDYFHFFTSPTLSFQLATSLSSSVRDNDFDGLVFDMGYTGFRDPRQGNNANSKNDGLMKFFRELGKQLHGLQKLLIVVVPPGAGFLTSDMISLADYVDRFSLMAYDYSTYQPGPNAPFPWFHSILSSLLGEHGQLVDDEETDSEDTDNSVHQQTAVHPLAHRLLIGMNFYGYDFSSSGFNRQPSAVPLLGRDYLRLLEKHKPKDIRWDDESKEHSVVYFEDEEHVDSKGKKVTTQIKHVVFYPSTRSIQVRLMDSFFFGAGVSIWEIGQGIDMFYNLL